MFRIQTINVIAEKGLNQFPKDFYEIATDAQHPDAILVRSSLLHDFNFPESVKVVARAGTGVNNIPISKLTKKGIPVLNAVGANANAVRELVIAGMLLASRNICQAWHFVRELKGNDQEVEKAIEQSKKNYVGFELEGKTLGIIGLGSIGVKVANAAMGLGMQVIGYDPAITVNRAWELSSGVQQASSIEELITKSDFLTFHVPLNEKTKNMLNTDRMRLIKTGAVILNFARKGIIDENALFQALTENKIFAYITDFPSELLRDHPRVIGLPHLGASTVEAEENCAMMISKQVRDYLEKGNIVNSVNFPTIQMPNNPDSYRIAIVNENVPNVVAQISSKLANAKLNIISLLNGSRDEIAYTLIDVNEEIHHDLLKEIENIDGIIRVRTIT